jgi:GDP-L-fucose synthase|tara:strand:+ start:1143 stop:2081 length:939 start_codon:yes stop_codon:yes gene_type:complete
MISSNSKIYVAGHNGLVGSAILRKLKIKGFKNVIFRSKKQLDLKNQTNVLKFLKRNKPDFIFIAAAKVGGIYSNNKYKAEYIYDNLIIQSNLIHSAYLSGVKNLIFLGSSCIYPRNCKQPIKESYLLTGKLEETNDSYAIAKIAGIKMCESYNAQYKTNYKCLMPTNTFGPNDNYDTMNSHFFPALIKKIHNLKMQNKEKLKLWGNGFAKREVIYVNDLADACIYFMNKKIKETFINIGSGKDYSIKQYARIIINNIIPEKNIKIEYDLSKPNGTPRKILDIKLTSKYGWKAKTNLNQAILETYKNFLSQKI